MQIPLKEVYISDQVVQLRVTRGCEVVYVLVELAHLILNSLNSLLQNGIQVSLSLAYLNL